MRCVLFYLSPSSPRYVAAAKTEEGTESHGMYFRINGAIMWSKGANMIPMEELEVRHIVVHPLYTPSYTPWYTIMDPRHLAYCHTVSSMINMY